MRAGRERRLRTGAVGDLAGDPGVRRSNGVAAGVHRGISRCLRRHRRSVTRLAAAGRPTPRSPPSGLPGRPSIRPRRHRCPGPLSPGRAPPPGAGTAGTGQARGRRDRLHPRGGWEGQAGARPLLGSGGAGCSGGGPGSSIPTAAPGDRLGDAVVGCAGRSAPVLREHRAAGHLHASLPGRFRGGQHNLGGERGQLRPPHGGVGQVAGRDPVEQPPSPSSNPGITPSDPTILAVMAFSTAAARPAHRRCPSRRPTRRTPQGRRPGSRCKVVAPTAPIDPSGLVRTPSEPARSAVNQRVRHPVGDLGGELVEVSGAGGQDRGRAVGRAFLKLSPRRPRSRRPRPVSTPSRSRAVIAVSADRVERRASGPARCTARPNQAMSS